LLIGVNNQYRGRDTAEYRIQFRELLQAAIGFAGKNPKRVIVVSIPDYGVTPFARERNPGKIEKEIDNFNRINKQETQIAGALYADITGISRKAKKDPALIASDGLHPSGEMYALWVKEIIPVASKILKEQRK
jgi:lysophospholipase L1-like esterase